MLPVELRTPREVAEAVAQRVKALRLDREWTQEELASRAGITLATYRRFERSGRISLERLLKIAVVLGALSEFDHLFRLPTARSLAELEERATRQRGKRRDATS